MPDITITLPAHGWKSRPYQRSIGDAFHKKIRYMLAIWHRRAGKDDVALHRECIECHKRIGTYWHMLPEASQARKAIWDAIDPHLGMRRIDIAFPLELRAVTRENEMLIKFKNGSVWQVVGSDNFNSLVGSPPIGLVSSEHALANPAAWAYLRPILLENQGWFLALTTPRGKNHAYRMLEAHKNDPTWFTEVLPASKTGVFTQAQLDAERKALCDEYGQDQGENLFAQEYLCSFDAAVLGAFYTRELADARAAGRIGKWPWVEGVRVRVGGDLGRRDSTALWFWQMIDGAPRFIDYHESTGHDVEWYVHMLRAKPYDYAVPPLWLPHDAKAETLASPRSIQVQFARQGFNSRIVAIDDLQDGIQAARATLRCCKIDAGPCEQGLEALGAYQREWDADKRTFKLQPLHNWASDGSDGFRYASVAWQVDAKPEPPRVPHFPLSHNVAPNFQAALDIVRNRRASN